MAGPGRKSLGTGPSPVIQTRIPIDLHDAFMEKVTSQHTTVSVVLRDLIQDYVDDVEALQRAWTR